MGEFGINSRTDDDSIWIVWNDPMTKGLLRPSSNDRKARNVNRS